MILAYLAKIDRKELALDEIQLSYFSKSYR